MNNSRIARFLEIIASSPELSRGFETPETRFERELTAHDRAVLGLD